MKKILYILNYYVIVLFEKIKEEDIENVQYL